MDVILIGAGGHGRVVLDAIRSAGLHRVVGFLDADETLAGTKVADVPVLGHPNHLAKHRGKAKGAFVSVGDNNARLSYARMLADAGLELVTVVHPAAAVSRSAKLGRNTIVAVNATVGVDAVIGDSAIINTAAVVDHECVIADAVHVAPGALLAGRVKVGQAAFIGMGAKVIQCLTVGDRAVVGAGAVVIKDVPPNLTVVGVPARATSK